MPKYLPVPITHLETIACWTLDPLPEDAPSSFPIFLSAAEAIAEAARLSRHDQSTDDRQSSKVH